MSAWDITGAVVWTVMVLASPLRQTWASSAGYGKWRVTDSSLWVIYSSLATYCFMPSFRSPPMTRPFLFLACCLLAGCGQ